MVKNMVIIELHVKSELLGPCQCRTMNLQRFTFFWQNEPKNGTRPDTWQDSRGWLGRGRNAKTTRYSKMLATDRPTRQVVESRVRD